MSIVLSRRSLLAALPLTPLLGQIGGKVPAKPPTDDDAPTISVDVELVNVLFTVRDKRNGLVPDLTKDDFEVLENNVVQDVKGFSKETNLPLTLGLLIDVSKSQERLIGEEQVAGTQFLKQVLTTKDQAFLISFGAEAELLQDFTNSVGLLRKGLDKLQVNIDASAVGPTPGTVPSTPRGTVMFDAVYLAAEERLRREVGRKAVILITDGVDQGSRLKRAEAITSALKSDTIIYSIYYADPYYQMGFGGGGYGDLSKMAEETGGRAFKAGRRGGLQEAFDQIQAELRTQYLLTYAPSDKKKDGNFRKLDIKVKNKDLKVQARKGRYAV